MAGKGKDAREGLRAGGRRAVLATAIAVVAALGVAGSASAATAQWTCGANAVTTSVAGLDPINPVTASRTPCADQSVGLPNTTGAVGLAPTIEAKTAYAITSAKPAAARPIEQGIGSAAGVEGLSLNTSGGTVVIGVDAARSEAAGTCQNGTPVLSGTSTVVGLTINGQTVKLDGLLSAVTDAISGSPLGGLVWVKLNEQVKDASGLIQRAAHIKVLDALGASPLADVIIAESRVSSASACDPNADGNGGNGTGTGTGGSGSGGTPQLCPTGSLLDTARGLCIIPSAQNNGQGDIIVGKPYTGPSGGRVVALGVARKRYSSPCLQGPGPKFAVIGTNKRDNITGRNDADRILALGGNDSVDGGRGNDCLDGGKGNDNLSGGIGNDKVYGLSGKDHLNGGPGSDRLSAGSGDDTVNAAYGRDNVYGGPGRDYINVATAGPPAKVDCGTGRGDKVRINRNEQRRVKHCETVRVFTGPSSS
jgi:Ca2+-binding RTX toxin-like protein